MLKNGEAYEGYKLTFRNTLNKFTTDCMMPIVKYINKNHKKEFRAIGANNVFWLLYAYMRFIYTKLVIEDTPIHMKYIGIFAIVHSDVHPERTPYIYNPVYQKQIRAKLFASPGFRQDWVLCMTQDMIADLKEKYKNVYTLPKNANKFVRFTYDDFDYKDEGE